MDTSLHVCMLSFPWINNYEEEDLSCSWHIYNFIGKTKLFFKAMAPVYSSASSLLEFQGLQIIKACWGQSFQISPSNRFILVIFLYISLETHDTGHHFHVLIYHLSIFFGEYFI